MQISVEDDLAALWPSSKWRYLDVAHMSTITAPEILEWSICKRQYATARSIDIHEAIAASTDISWLAGAREEE
jgi:hypothetical protein